MAPSNHQKHQAGRRLAVAEALLHGLSGSLHSPQTFVTISGRTAIYPVSVEAWRNRWSLFEDVAQPVSGETASCLPRVGSASGASAGCAPV
ncbi:hypothetical protein GA0070607_5086 [Micromonospora coriariae]|uniref:Uncharacterized protein n=1 Tax=Micromonospora coriariae TaxID=285665 RepID=A0A1C4XD54_9ACTN|nr:hypothetical protein GA0070607_5086 [Micromonospora coriariae]